MTKTNRNVQRRISVAIFGMDIRFVGQHNAAIEPA